MKTIPGQTRTTAQNRRLYRARCKNPKPRKRKPIPIPMEAI